MFDARGAENTSGEENHFPGDRKGAADPIRQIGQQESQHDERQTHSAPSSRARARDSAARSPRNAPDGAWTSSSSPCPIRALPEVALILETGLPRADRNDRNRPCAGGGAARPRRRCRSRGIRGRHSHQQRGHRIHQPLLPVQRRAERGHDPAQRRNPRAAHAGDAARDGARQRAWILNVASVGAFFPMPSMPVYSCTKTFVFTFSRLLRAELRGTGVGVSVLCPNGIRTNRQNREMIERQGWAGRVTCRYPDEVARAASGASSAERV